MLPDTYQEFIENLCIGNSEASQQYLTMQKKISWALTENEKKEEADESIKWKETEREVNVDMLE